jgi:tetratricopeptide (TPR) repeat protein
VIRLLLALVLCASLPLADAAERLSPRLSQRLFVIMERAVEDPQTALGDLRELLESRSMSPTEKGFIAYEIAGLLIQLDQVDTAVGELQDILDAGVITFIPRLRRLFAQLLLMDNRPELALEQMEIWAGEVEDPMPTELILMGYTYLQLERFADATVYLERSIAESEAPPPQWTELLAYAYTRTGRTGEAVSLLESLIATQPDQTRWWRQLASLYLLIEDIPKGTAGLVVAAQIEELTFQDSRRLAGLFTTLGMPADAATLFSAAIDVQRARDPQAIGFEDHMLLGEMWMLARELELAVQSFATAANLKPDSEPYLKTAQLYLQWERYTEARAALQEAVRIAGESAPAQVLYLLAITEINLGNLESASQAIARLQNDPEYAERAERLDRFVINSLNTR